MAFVRWWAEILRAEESWGTDSMTEMKSREVRARPSIVEFRASDSSSKRI